MASVAGGRPWTVVNDVHHTVVACVASSFRLIIPILSVTETEVVGRVVN